MVRLLLGDKPAGAPREPSPERVTQNKLELLLQGKQADIGRAEIVALVSKLREVAGVATKIIEGCDETSIATTRPDGKLALLFMAILACPRHCAMHTLGDRCVMCGEET